MVYQKLVQKCVKKLCGSQSETSGSIVLNTASVDILVEVIARFLKSFARV